MTKEKMTSKERILTAMRGGIPDRVPVQLGVYTNAPKIVNATARDVYYYGKQSLPKLMAMMAEHFGFDGYIYAGITQGRLTTDHRKWKNEIVRQDDEFIVQRTTAATPYGNLWEERTFPKNDPPMVTRGFVKTAEDFKLYLEYFFFDHYEWDTTRVAQAKSLLGDLGAVGAAIGGLPGLHDLINIFDGKLEAATYFCADYPELVEEYRQKKEYAILTNLPRTLEAKPDYITMGCSGLLTLSTPDYVRKLSLPTLQKVAKMCRQAGIPSELHCCGKERLIVEMCANETEVDSINPLQPPPMGDCDLAEVKRSFGKRICLKGNVGVTHPMLLGSPAEVEKDIIRCMDAAKAGGGYILFTEEGLGRDTPFENIRKFVEVGKALGKY